MLAEFAGHIGLEIEMKSPEPELPAAVAATLAGHRDAWPTIELTSSSPSLLALVRDRCPGIRTALLLGASAHYMRDDVVGYAAVQMTRLARADIVHLGLDQLSAEVLSTVRAAGIEVHVYPVNNEPALDVVAGYAISEVITDEPARLLALRRSRSARP